METAVNSIYFSEKNFADEMLIAYKPDNKTTGNR